MRLNFQVTKLLVRGPRFEETYHSSDPSFSQLLGNKDHRTPRAQESPSQRRDDPISPHNCHSLGTEVPLMSCGTSLGLTFPVSNTKRKDQGMFRRPSSCVSSPSPRETSAQHHLHVCLGPALSSPLPWTLD